MGRPWVAHEVITLAHGSPDAFIWCWPMGRAWGDSAGMGRPWVYLLFWPMSPLMRITREFAVTAPWTLHGFGVRAHT